MRLFRRRDNEAASTPDPEGPAIGAPAGSDDDGVARQAKQPTGDWMTVAPLAPSFSPSMPTTFRVQTLPEILTSHRDTRLSSSLGHAVSPDAPSGSIGGLTSHAGDVSHNAGMGSLELREPVHHAAPAETPALEVRRLADPSPISTSSPASLPSTAPVAPRLPEPTVSRSLLDTAPLVSRAPSERPLPVARVVDAPAASAAPTPASAPTAASPSATTSLSSEPPPADDAPLAGADDRVGGFGVDDDGIGSFGGFAAEADDVPRTTAPPELAPPIQPRRIQRRLDGMTPAPSSRPSAAAPLIGDTAPATSVDPVVPEAPAAATGSSRGELPLAHPPAAPAPAVTVSRMADTSTSATLPSGSSAAMTAAAGDAPRQAASSAPSPIQRVADEGRPAASAEEATAAPLSSGLSTSALPDTSRVGDTSSIGGGGELPLHTSAVQPPIQRLADTGMAAPSSTPASPSVASTPPADGDAATGPDAPVEDAATSTPEPAIEPPTTSTLGADAQPMVSVQPMADSAGPPTSAPSPGTASLPLAPSDLGGTLQPPAPRGPAADVQRQPEASSASRPLATPLRPSATAAAPSVQRLATTPSTPSGSTSAPSTGGTATLPFVRPIATAAAAPTAVSPTSMSMLAPPAAGSTASSDLPVQLRRLGAPDVGDGVATVQSLSSPPTASGATGPLPLASLQRVEAGAASSTTTSTHAGPAPSANDGHAAPDLPLHTPAASIPSAADVAVRAGLAERGPDGSLFTTTPPATSSFTLQRAVDADLAVQTERMSAAGNQRRGSASAAGPATAAFSAGPASRSGGGDDDDEGPAGKSTGKDATSDTKKLAADAKKLYPYIRSALEADIRRQLEGKSRANRFRP